MSLKSLVAVGAATALASAGLVLVPATAQASISQCTPGNACLWGENNYSGCFVQYSSDKNSFGSWATCGASANNGANSVKNYGRSCNVVFFDATGRTGPGIRFDKTTQGNYQDPKLSNGGGVGYGGNTARQNWENRISSLDFCK
jgi:hypothetical protein